MYSAKVLKKKITVILSLNVLKRLLAIMRLNLSTKSAQIAPLEPVGYLTEIYHQKIGQKTDLNTSWCSVPAIAAFSSSKSLTSTAKTCVHAMDEYRTAPRAQPANLYLM